jgi:hypothetical protein
MAEKTATHREPTGSATNGAGAAKARQRARLSQEDVPSYSVEQALRVPRAIGDSYAYRPTRPLNVAGAMKMSPGSGPFRTLTGAAIAYGLTTGGAFAPEIGITPLGMRIVRPTKPGDDIAATREALLRPKIVGEFLRQYDGAALPPDQIAKNVLLEKGVPVERVDDVLTLIVDGADAVGLLKDIGGKRYVDLAGADVVTPQEPAAGQPVPPAPGEQTLPVAPAPPSTVSVGPGVHINIEIHIAADATSDTIEEIFRNMRRYVLSSDGAVTEE